MEWMLGQCDGCPEGLTRVCRVTEPVPDPSGYGEPPRMVTFTLCAYHLDRAES